MDYDDILGNILDRSFPFDFGSFYSHTLLASAISLNSYKLIEPSVY